MDQVAHNKTAPFIRRIADDALPDWTSRGNAQLLATFQGDLTGLLMEVSAP